MSKWEMHKGFIGGDRPISVIEIKRVSQFNTLEPISVECVHCIYIEQWSEWYSPLTALHNIACDSWCVLEAPVVLCGVTNDGVELCETSDIRERRERWSQYFAFRKSLCGEWVIMWKVFSGIQRYTQRQRCDNSVCCVCLVTGHYCWQTSYATTIIRTLSMWTYGQLRDTTYRRHVL